MAGVAHAGPPVAPSEPAPWGEGERDAALFSGASSREEAVVFVLVSDEVLQVRDDEEYWARKREYLRDRRKHPDPSPEQIRGQFPPIQDRLRRDLDAAAREFDRRGGRTGLVVTGRRLVSCEAADLTVAPDFRTAPAIRDELRKTSARGRAPVYRALREALEGLKASSAPRKRIVLYSHCGNNCAGADPLQILDDIHRQKFPVRIDVRMYGADFDQEAQLRKIARYTGGTYRDTPRGACRWSDHRRPEPPGPVAMPSVVATPEFIESEGAGRETLADPEPATETAPSPSPSVSVRSRVRRVSSGAVAPTGQGSLYLPVGDGAAEEAWPEWRPPGVTPSASPRPNPGPLPERGAGVAK